MEEQEKDKDLEKPSFDVYLHLIFVCATSLVLFGLLRSIVTELIVIQHSQSELPLIRLNNELVSSYL